jgi:hypothetical protein
MPPPLTAIELESFTPVRIKSLNWFMRLIAVRFLLSSANEKVLDAGETNFFVIASANKVDIE